MMMSVVVMRYKVETAMEKHAPRKNDNPLGVQQVIPNPQNNQNQRNRVEEVKERLPRLHEISGTPKFTLRGLTDKSLDCEENEHR